MADEKRKLIYELLVEAKGMSQQLNAATGEMGKLNAAASSVMKLFKQGFVIGGIGFSIKALADVVSEYSKLNSELKTLGLTSADAATGLREIEKISVQTGQSLSGVTEIYKNAVEATQAIGGSQADATRLAAAFARDLAAQGKSADAAAQQLEKLGFSLESGVVKGKEFLGLLKENNTLQAAAEQALGKTTAQLADMAKAGEIGAGEIRKILDVFVELAEQEKVPITLGNITEALKTVGKAFVQATADGLGFNDALSDMNRTGLTTFLEAMRSLGLLIGGVVRLFFNLAEVVNDTFAALVDLATLGPLQAWRNLRMRLDQEWRDMAASVKAINESIRGSAAAAVGAPAAATGPNLAAGFAAQADAMEKARDARQEARRQEHIKEIYAEVEADKKAAEKTAENRKKAADKGAAAMIDALKKAGAFAEQQRLEAQSKPLIEAGEMARLQEKQVQEALEENDRLIKSMGDGLEHLKEPTIRFAFQMSDIADTLKDNSYILTNSLADAFVGATKSAKEFFHNVLQGFAQVFAQQAAFQATSWIKTLFPAAQGAAIAGGQVMPFASGGIVAGPTTFPMRGGKTGLMGEAGAEAIMPLRRSRSGALGVVGVAPQVHLHNNTGTQMEARVSGSNERLSIILEAAQLGAGMAEDRINRSMRTGYGPTAGSIQRTYGLRRRV